jgi:hypothetical protein
VLQDWYRNTNWTPDVAQRFEEKLRRARSRDQYLRIQALCLVKSHPDVALSLIDRFFALKDPFSSAAALDVKAQALTSLGRVEEAWSTYEEVLLAEEKFPNVKTNAFADMSYLAVTHGLTHHYERVLQILDASTSMLRFPVLGFIYHACRAVIFETQGRAAAADDERTLALELASRRTSGPLYHREVGLVGERESPLLKKLHGFRDA